MRLKPFWIGKCEVTWDEFDLYLRTATRTSRMTDGDEQKPDAPKKVPKASPADAVTRSRRKPYVDETYGFERESTRPSA